MNLTELGWTAEYAAFCAYQQEPPSKNIARVLASNRNIAWVQSEADPFSAYIAPSGSRLDTYPVVGDWCELDAPTPRTSQSRITSVLPRRTQICRKQSGRSVSAQVMAANVDQALILTSRNEEFSWNRLDRYLAMVLSDAVRPIICLTKAELDLNRVETAKLVQAHFPEIQVVSTSAVTGLGVDELGDILPPHSTSILLGSSGVGKSTLTNRLLKSEHRATRSIREADDKGRHTTSNSRMFPLPKTGWLIDAPGLREIEPWDAQEGIEASFADIEWLAQQCRFRNCNHDTERDCAVIAAIEQGLLGEQHLASYHRLKREQQYQEEKTDRQAQANKRKQIRSITRQVRKSLRAKQRLD